MSDRMTAVYLPGLSQGSGWAEYGRVNPAEMIKALKRNAAHAKAEAEIILAAPDHEFRVETYVGVHVQKRREIIQEGRAP